jgi:hypothetical protein
MNKPLFHLCLVALCLVLTSTAAQAKENNFKFGKITPEEMNSTICPIDSNAHAYYIFDKGSAMFDYVQGFQIRYERHFRIKILDKAGLENASFTIPYYDNNQSKEDIKGIKAVTYNLEGGKIIKTPIEKSAIFDEETSKYWRQIKFALPNVKEGSVIEVTYSSTTNVLWNFPGWPFQKNIPVIYSNYEVSIPEYFDYNQFHKGYLYAKTTQGYATGSIPLANGQSSIYQQKTFNYLIENIPAFPVGEELTTPKNYIGTIDFELASVNIPGSLYKDFSNTWKDVNDTFIKDSEFGERLNNTYHLKTLAEEIKTKATTDLEKAQLAFQSIKTKMKWNEINSCWCNTPLKKSFETAVGSSADINLNLVALLTELGLRSAPIVLSTRNNGMIRPTSPSINQLNYVIAMCRIDGVSYLMDATNKYAEIDILPSRCLNDKGWIVSNTFSGWEKLLKDKKSKETVVYNLELTPEGKFTGKVNNDCQEFKALYMRNNINNFESKDKYIEKLEENNSGLLVNEYEFENLDTTGVGFKSNFDVTISDKVETAGDLLFFNPLFFDAYDKNPLSLEKREYPVEYPYPIVEVVVANITLPEGYKIESLPQNAKVSAIDNSCQFVFRAGLQNNQISIVSTLQINQTIIPGTQYAEIKGFFEEVVKKHAEKVVLKKI